MQKVKTIERNPAINHRYSEAEQPISQEQQAYLLELSGRVPSFQVAQELVVRGRELAKSSYQANLAPTTTAILNDAETYGLVPQIIPLAGYLENKDLEFDSQRRRAGQHVIEAVPPPEEWGGPNPSIVPLGRDNDSYLFVQNIALEQKKIERTSSLKTRPSNPYALPDPLVAQVEGSTSDNKALGALAAQAERTQTSLISNPRITLKEVPSAVIEHIEIWYRLPEEAAISEQVPLGSIYALARLAKTNHDLLSQMPQFALAAPHSPDIASKPAAYQQFLLEGLPETKPVWISLNSDSKLGAEVLPYEANENRYAARLSMENIQQKKNGALTGSFYHQEYHPDFPHNLSVGRGEMRFLGTFGGEHVFIANVPHGETHREFLERQLASFETQEAIRAQLRNLRNPEVAAKFIARGYKINLPEALADQPAFMQPGVRQESDNPGRKTSISRHSINPRAL